MWPERPFGRVPFWAMFAHDSSAGYKDTLLSQIVVREAKSQRAQASVGSTRLRSGWMAYHMNILEEIIIIKLTILRLLRRVRLKRFNSNKSSRWARIP